MHADPKKVASRRALRRVKAAGSIVLALAAGAFVACQRGVQSFVGEPSASAPKPDPQASGLPDAAAASAPGRDAGSDASEIVADAAHDMIRPADAAYGEPADARADSYRVDAGEHRKGMPVPDNLLE